MENRLLHAAIDQQDFSWATYLLGELNADPNCVDPESGIAAIHLAVGMASSSAPGFVRTLLTFGADPNLKLADGCTPLHVAAGWGRTKALHILLENGADPDVKDSDGLSPLDYAVKEGNHDIAAILRLHAEPFESQELEDQYTIEKVEVEDAETACPTVLLSLEDLRLDERWGQPGSGVETRSEVCLSDDEFKSCVSSMSGVSEAFKYTDRTKGVSLIEKRLNNAMGALGSKPVSETSDELRGSFSSLLSLNSELGYSTDRLAGALREKGQRPGPITKTTKTTYARQLARLRRGRKSEQNEPEQATKYSRELEKTLKDLSSFDAGPASALEQQMAEDFASLTSKGSKMRGGHHKTNFTYLLLDPRVTLNLPLRAPELSPEQTWRVFVESIFYVGKGQGSRPYAHLYQAHHVWKGKDAEPGPKVARILDIWKAGSGVVCLHVFHSVIPVEAHTREAAMIDAIGRSNLCNIKGGEYYGMLSSKSASEQRHFGVYLLRNAMNIFLHEGERQLFPTDLSS